MNWNAFEVTTLLIVLASVFGYINYKTLKLPFAIGITVAALMASTGILAIDALVPSLTLAEQAQTFLAQVDFTEALMRGMLSFLLFAGALHVNLDDLRSQKLPILAMASLGVGLSTVLMGFGSYALFGALGLNVPLPYCLVFGALVSPTDPVAVLGIMKAAGASKAHEVKIVGESLFNDGVGVVVFTVLLAYATGGGGHGGELDAMGVVKVLGQEVVGGVGLGLIGGYVTFWMMRDMDEANLEILMSVALVMGVTTVSLALHASAPLACVVAGLFIGNQGRTLAMSSKTQLTLDKVWHFIDELLNAVLFLLIGLEVMAVAKGSLPTAALIAALIAVPLALAARYVSVAVPVTMLRRAIKFEPGTIRILTWGGLKGGISIALALSLPRVESYDTIVTATYAVVIFSIVIQGLTVGRLIQWIKARYASKDEAASAAQEAA